MSFTVTELVRAFKCTEGLSGEMKLPLRAFARLSTVRPVSQGKLDDMFYGFISDVRADNDVKVGWIKVQASEPERHLRVALIASVPLNCSQVANRWSEIDASRYVPIAKIKPYRGRVCPVSYVLTRLDSIEDLEFSDNLVAVCVEYIQSQFKSSPTSSGHTISISTHK